MENIDYTLSSIPVTEPVAVDEMTKKSSPAIDIVCGSMAGATGKIIEYPFDTIKVRLQSQPNLGKLMFNGPLDCFVKSIKSEGMRGLYRGMASPMVGAAAENACLFFAYNKLQDLLKPLKTMEILGTNQMSLLCGAGSGAFASFVLTPIELVKCRIQVQLMQQASLQSDGRQLTIDSSRRVGALRTVVDIYRTSGFLGFWRGQTGTLIRESGGSAAWFGAYEYVSKVLRQQSGNPEAPPTAAQSMLAGAAAGVSYNLSLFPADTVKSRMQTEAVLLDGSQGQGFWSTLKSIYKNGGVRALYRGCGVTIARSAPSSAIIFLVYENLTKAANELI